MCVCVCVKKMIEANIMTEQQGSISDVKIVSTNNAKIDNALDLNPTAFIDDLYNAVELHCATAFDELDVALRTALDDRLNIDQTMALLQGTAGLYQDLRTELRNRMETFEKYALAEILRVPPGLLQSAAASTIGRGDASINEEDLKRREEAVDDRIESLRKEIAATKRRTRDMNVTVMELDRLLQENQSQLASLQAVPNVLASTTDTNKEIQTIVHKGLEIEKKYSELDAIRKAQVDTGSEAIDDTFPADRMAMAITTVNVEEDMPDSAVEKEILRRQAASKIAPAEDLRKLRQNLGL